MVLQLSRSDEQGLERFDLARLGLSPENLARLKRLLNRRHGLVVVAGGWHSGKTTALYSCLRHLENPERNLVSIEDGIRFRLPGVNQVALHHRAGLIFSSALRASLRQDPDVILVGVLHDSETSRLALEAALERHLVLAGSYAGSAAEAISRFAYMGMEPFKVAGAVSGAMAIRLARKLCVQCRKAYKPSPAAEAALGIGGPHYTADGCEFCTQRGYRGLVGLQEVMALSAQQREVLLRRGSTEELVAAASDFVPLKEDGSQKTADGLISPEELVRVISDI